MTSVHRITVFHNRVLVRFRHPERRKKPNGDFRDRKDGLSGSESRTFRKKKQAFGRKDVSIHRKCPYVLEISPIVFPNISYCFPKYLLLLFQIRSERDTPSSGWQPQAELSEVTKKSECNPIRSTFTTDTTFSFPCAYHQSKAPRYMSSGKTFRTRFFHPGKHPVRNKRF